VDHWRYLRRKAYGTAEVRVLAQRVLIGDISDSRLYGRHGKKKCGTVLAINRKMTVRSQLAHQLDEQVDFQMNQAREAKGVIRTPLMYDAAIGAFARSREARQLRSGVTEWRKQLLPGIGWRLTLSPTVQYFTYNVLWSK
jgi:hypothetical protein